jgi:sec-independent protein translocase protein TatB
MFDGIGFTELLLIGVISLVVLGPEKMPGAVRTLALVIGRIKRNFNSIKTEIEKEIGADEIRRQLRNEEIMEKFRHTQAQVNNTISSLKQDAETFQKNVELEAQAAGGVIPNAEVASTTASTSVAATESAPAASGTPETTNTASPSTSNTAA